MPYIYLDPLPSLDLTSFGITNFLIFHFMSFTGLLSIVMHFSSIYHKHHKAFLKNNFTLNNYNPKKIKAQEKHTSHFNIHLL